MGLGRSFVLLQEFRAWYGINKYHYSLKKSIQLLIVFIFFIATIKLLKVNK